MRGFLDIIRFSWPLALGMANNAVLQFTDRVFLAHESMASLEAVLPASMLASVVLGFFQSVVSYSGTFVAQYHGAGKAAMERLALRAGLVIALVSGALVIAALPLGNLLFEVLGNGESDVISRQKTYYDICTAGGVFLFGQIAVQSYFTGIGRTRLVLWVNLIGNALNVALDPLLIFGYWGFPRLGIAGAAYATVIATAVQWAMLAWTVRSDRQPPKSADLPPLLPLVGRVLRFGIPAGAYGVLNSLSFTVFVFFTGAVGHVAAAVSNASFSVCYLLFAPMEGFALGAQALVAQDRGRGDDRAAMRTGLRAMVLGSAISLALSLAAVAFRHPILDLFAPEGVEVAGEFHRLGSTLFMLMAAWQVFDASDTVLSGALKGAGDTRFVMWWMLVVAFALWLPLAWLVTRVHNTMPALWSTTVVYVVVLCVGSIIRWLRGHWRSIRLT